MTTDKNPTGLALLRAPFPPDQIGRLPKRNKNGSTTFLDYVGHADLTARLLDADTEWWWEPVAYDERGLPAFDNHGGLWIRLHVCGVTRLGYGDAQGKQGPNAVKEAIGDALRNAAMRFGAALDLWAKGDRSYAEAEAEHEAALPQHVQAVLGAIGNLSDENRDALRAWYSQQEFPPVRDLAPDQAKAVLLKAEEFTGGWPATPEVPA